MEVSQLEALVAEMRRLGVTRFRSGEVEIDLGRPPPSPAAPDKPPPEQMSAEMRAKLVAGEKNRTKRTLLAAASVVARNK